MDSCTRPQRQSRRLLADNRIHCFQRRPLQRQLPIIILDTLLPLYIHTGCFPPRHYHAITLFPFVFYNGKALTDREKRHEIVHLWQQIALLVIIFYLLYFLFWLFNIIRYRNFDRAYHEIPFERSAYYLENQPSQPHKVLAFHWLSTFKR